MQIRKTKLSRSKCIKCGELYLTHHLKTKYCQKCFDVEVRGSRLIKELEKTIDFVQGVRDSDRYTLPEMVNNLR